MNKAESKYFNTARLMDKALLILLEKKDINEITVKEICEKAGVNRTTFYLHYQNIDDLFQETIDMLNNDFKESFEIKEIKPIIKKGNAEELIFIREEFIRPYLQFVKENKRVLKMIHKKPMLFNNEKVYKQMCEELFYPILTSFGVLAEEQPYRLEYFTRGTIGIINKWIENNCEMSIEKIVNIIIDCVNFSREK
jgi:AcrR family transcriptional regulator